MPLCYTRSMTQENVEINSAILEEDFHKIVNKLESGRDLVDVAQIDICDGEYVPSKTFLSAGCPDSAVQLKMATKDIELELDMMIDWQVGITGRFEKWLNVLTVLKPSRIVLHHSSISNEHLETLSNTINPTTTEFGLGIHLDDELSEMVARFDAYPFTYVQIMGIEKVGYGGQSQSDKLIPYIKAFKALRPDTPISIDGGVKLENAKDLAKAGAIRLTVGSGLFDANNIERRAQDLRNEVV